MSPPIALASVCLLGILNSVHSEYFNSSKVTMNLLYGPKRSDSVGYPLIEAEKIFDDPHFNRESTVFYIEDYHEPQLAEYRQYIMVDEYNEAQVCNFLALDWGTGYVPLDDIKDPDLDTLVPLVTAFLIKLHDRTDWGRFSGLGYARGVEFMHFVSKDLFQKAGITILRVTQLAPQRYYLTEADTGEIIPDFVDTIHTDIGKHESAVSKSHAEFFPNGGVDPQPGCSADSGRLDVCSRQRAKLLWGESLRKPYAFCATPANKNEDYAKGTDGPLTEVPMGVECPWWARGKFNLRTNAESPYGQGCTM